MSSYVQVSKVRKSGEIGRTEVNPIFEICFNGNKRWIILDQLAVILHDQKEKINNVKSIELDCQNN